MKLFNLKPDWPAIVRKAWSMRLWAAAALLQIIAFAFDVISSVELGFAIQITLQITAVALSLAGMYARVVIQRDLTK